ncbi:5-dehydro-4-deoxy-D-glucuronate isomerase [Echinicola vietnamensis]|uniref:4-deoxy-L-threo-5-hexosulose-uronate ketol-isomerase n=1 Tax=Echinicola vietnamensis (strain DSM 17526 / LMG 23754 / KMM 6221) TaxID=926556 RepID=L0G4H0_ECHVK|nr:5-dehydro-4-deoxy-D-glucuronate isomerase [Echinicola vietnamensis]AGA80213.1 5-keto 4-deoxyuronate isomerase [Echinicola vietnamensis DSM 17526]
MHTNIVTRYGAHPDDVKSYDTQKLRDHFLLENIFQDDKITGVYSMFDRYIVGGIAPVNKALELETVDQLKADYFLERRELGVINVGAPTLITVDGTDHKLNTREALYVGRGVKEVIFNPSSEGQAFLYFNSAPAHTSYPTKKVGLEDAEKVELGSMEESNHRVINKLIVNSVVKSCQLQMGMTQLKPGSVWNTMPAHTHDRRMEAYFYFDLAETAAVCHYMGQPHETRHIWMKNHEAVLSPAWSIHAGSGTSNYTFIWGMAGENLDYGDMDKVAVTDMK